VPESSPSRDLAKGPDLTWGGGTEDPPGGPGMSPRELRTGTHRVQCSSMEVRTQRCFLGCIILPRHVVPLGLPMWWGRVSLSV
jgi:hypothetical protein